MKKSEGPRRRFVKQLVAGFGGIMATSFTGKTNDLPSFTQTKEKNSLYFVLVHIPATRNSGAAEHLQNIVKPVIP